MVEYTTVTTKNSDGNVRYAKTLNDGTTAELAFAACVHMMGGAHQVSCEITRPANTTAYTNKDAVADNAPSIATHLFAGAARLNGGHGYIQRASIASDNALAAGMQLVIYREAPISGFIADNSPFDVLYEDKAPTTDNMPNVVGTIQLPVMASIGAGSDADRSYEAISGIENIEFVCEDDVDDLYFQMFIVGTATPASGQKFTVTLHVLQD